MKTRHLNLMMPLMKPWRRDLQRLPAEPSWVMITSLRLKTSPGFVNVWHHAAHLPELLAFQSDTSTPGTKTGGKYYLKYVHKNMQITDVQQK